MNLTTVGVFIYLVIMLYNALILKEGYKKYKKLRARIKEIEATRVADIRRAEIMSALGLDIPVKRVITTRREKLLNLSRSSTNPHEAALARELAKKAK